MTRFARAKGSKASNERAPEDSTPWEVMKEQLLKAKKESDETKKRQAAENQRIVNYENFLKEQKVLKRKATWCDFPHGETKTKSTNAEKYRPLKKKIKQNKIEENSESTSKSAKEFVQVQTINESVQPKQKNKKKKQKLLANSESKEISAESTSKTEPEKGSKKNKKKKGKKHIVTPDMADKTYSDSHEVGDINTKENETSDKVTKEKQSKYINKKLVNGNPVRRKEINDRSFQLIINGKEIELVRFDGFPIMKKDAERLQELKTSMIEKGIPKSEVQRTLKLERRRAEKALARIKREVCYNCRKGGHVLSDCPELKTKIPGVDAADGVCFKCGSSEHRQFECKVQKDKEFRFATCFICKEAGHIARQCPDNPRGLYPNGGCCKLCGDVTHLRKDCPTATDKKEETNIKLQTLEGAENIEDVGHQSKMVNQDTSKKPKKIKF